ncbi:MAG: Lrp/AsnC family transcriptional regulator [Actinomycetota bacterium]|nr:Lrp/AsnC family transcriptional regulator [Actinomycetota bacterium]
MASIPLVDRTDRAIVGLLQQNARLSNKEIAATVGIAQSTCSERIRRLEAASVFRGFHADVDPAVLGVGLQAMIAVRLHRHETTQVERFRRYTEQLPDVVAFYHMAGTNDFLVHVVVRDSDHLRDIAMGAFTAQPEVAHIETSIIFEHTRFRRLPDYGAR